MSYHPPPMLKMHLAEVSCQLARLFISAGADPDTVNKDGRTPMMVAILQVCYFSFYNNRAIFRSVDRGNDVVMAEFVFLFFSRAIFQETEMGSKKCQCYRKNKQTNRLLFSMICSLIDCRNDFKMYHHKSLYVLTCV